MKSPILLLSLTSIVLLGVISCKHKEPVITPTTPTITYGFTNTASMYSGDTVTFTSDAPAGNSVSWFFGNRIYAYPYSSSYDFQNVVYPTCDTFGNPNPCDELTGISCKHAYYTPGTYVVTQTVNNDTATTTKKVFTIISPEHFSSGITGLRNWQREYYYWDNNGDTTFSMPDTSFSVAITSGYCQTPQFSFPFKVSESSSSTLTYGNNHNPHIEYNGLLQYDIIHNKILIREVTYSGHITITYHSLN